MSSPPDRSADDEWVPHYEPPAWYTGALAEEAPDGPGGEWVPQYKPPAWYTGPLPEDGPDGPAPQEGGGGGSVRE